MKLANPILYLLMLSLSIMLVACGGDTKQNPHSQRFIVGESESVVVDTDTNTRNNDVIQDEAAQAEDLILERNFICPTGGVSLSVAPIPKFVMVGEQGTLLISNDGDAWAAVGAGVTTSTLNAVVRGRNIFVAVGDAGTALCSPNGHDWFVIELTRKVEEAGVEKVVKETGKLTAVATDGNQFVIVGHKGIIYTNTSNTAWSRIVEGSFVSNFYDIVWARGLFVAVGGDADPREDAPIQANLIHSTNGVFWTVSSVRSQDEGLVDIVWTGKRFVAAGKKITPPEEDEKPCRKDCPTQNSLYLSSDGYAWTRSVTVFPAEFGEIKSAELKLVYGNSSQVTAIGTAVLGNSTVLNYQFQLTQGVNGWQYKEIEGKDYVDVLIDALDPMSTSDDLRYSLISTGGVTALDIINNTSTSAISTTSFTVKLNDIETSVSAEVRAVCPDAKVKKVVLDNEPQFFGSNYVLVADAGKVYTSAAGETWVTETLKSEEKLNAIIRSRESFYIVGDEGGIYCSRSGRDWRSLSSGVTTSLTSIASDGQIYVAVGDEGVVLTTINGVQWDQGDFPVSERINKIIWADDQYVAIGGDFEAGEAGFIYTSTNGLDWSVDRLATAGLVNPVFLNDVIWTGRQYVAVGYTNDCATFPCDNTNGLVLTSADGLNWAQEVFPVKAIENNSRYVRTKLTSVASRGNEIVVLGRGNISSVNDTLIFGANTHKDPWTLQDYAEAATEHYSTLVYHDGKYVLGGERGVFALTSASLNEVDVTSLGDININALAINGVLPTTAVVGKAFSYTPVAWEPDGQRLKYSLSFNETDFPWISMDPTTGTLSGTPEQGHSGKIAEARAYAVEQIATGAKMVLSEFFDFTVVDNMLPVISGMPEKSTIVTLLNDTFYFSPTAYDGDEDQNLTFSIVNQPSWATFDSNTGVLYGTPGRGQEAEYPGITISVDDGIDTVALAPFTLKVVYLPTSISL